VPECNQALLLQGGFHLEEQRALSHYWDHLQHGYVFLFDRNSLRPSALNSATSTSTSVSTSRSSTLPVYERARADADRALDRARQSAAAVEPPHRLSSLHGAAHSTAEQQLVELLHSSASTAAVVDALCEEGHHRSAEQRLQLLALCTAVESLSLHTRPVFDDFNRLWHHYEAQRRRHSSLLASFDADLFRLRDHRVPAQLATSTAASPSPSSSSSSSSASSGSRRGAAASAEPASASTGGATLYDCVSAEALQEWATKCRVRHQQLTGKASRIQQAVQELRTGKQQENQPPEFNEAELKSWRAELVACKQHTAEVVSEAWERSSRLDVRLQDQQRNWPRTDDRSLEAWVSQARNTLENNCTKSVELLVLILTSKHRFTDYLHGRLRHISLLQSRVRQVSEKLVIFREDIIFQKDTFHQLSIVKGMPTAFCAAQEETARRRQWSAQVQKGVCVCVCVRTRV
jgi:Autophagy protein ATG17-like domain